MLSWCFNKGNVLLQYLGLTSEDITAISERDPRKVGLVTPGSNIPICLKMIRNESRLFNCYALAFLKGNYRTRARTFKVGNKIHFCRLSQQYTPKNFNERIH